MTFILEAKDIDRSYRDGIRVVDVLKSVSCAVAAGESIAIVGASGSGKSTLMHLLGGLEVPDQGEILFEGRDLANMSQKQRTRLRGEKIGFVYQFHHLLPEFTALENVAMPLLIAGQSPAKAEQVAFDVLTAVGLQQRVEHRPSELSGGERQRAAIARAMVNKPRLLLADEPTGNLDEKTAADVFDLLLEMNQELSSAMIVVTHDTNLANRTQRVLYLKDGQLL